MPITIKDIQYDLENKSITILKPMKRLEIYSQLKEDWMNNNNLITYEFPMRTYLLDNSLFHPLASGDKIEYIMRHGWKLIGHDSI